MINPRPEIEPRVLCRSSKASEVFRQVYGGSVPVLDDEKHAMRLLVSTIISIPLVIMILHII